MGSKYMEEQGEFNLSVWETTAGGFYQLELNNYSLSGWEGDDGRRNFGSYEEAIQDGKRGLEAVIAACPGAKQDDIRITVRDVVAGLETRWEVLQNGEALIAGVASNHQKALRRANEARGSLGRVKREREEEERRAHRKRMYEPTLPSVDEAAERGGPQSYVPGDNLLVTSSGVYKVEVLGIAPQMQLACERRVYWEGGREDVALIVAGVAHYGVLHARSEGVNLAGECRCHISIEHVTDLERAPCVNLLCNFELAASRKQLIDDVERFTRFARADRAVTLAESEHYRALGIK